MDRRTLLWRLGTGALALAAGARGRTETRRMTTAGRLPTLFLAHGSPMSLEDAPFMDALAGWTGALPRPRALLVLSAHWEAAPVTLGATRRVPLVYDFYGFPEHLYRIQYPSPGAPELADRVVQLLGGPARVARSERGLDHGTYIPLMAMYPQADLPVLQVSLPSLDPATLFELGRALAPLRDEGVLIIGSGFLSHNLRVLRLYAPDAPPVGWAREFDHWCAETLARRDVDALLGYRTRAPAVDRALPTHEHFVPVITAMGAAMEPGARVTFPVEGFMFGALTLRSAQFG